jgi:hypothetical protein
MAITAAAHQTKLGPRNVALDQRPHAPYEPSDSIPIWGIREEPDEANPAPVGRSAWPNRWRVEPVRDYVDLGLIPEVLPIVSTAYRNHIKSFSEELFASPPLPRQTQIEKASY